MSTPKVPKAREERQAREVEESQSKLRASIAHTKKLLDDSDEMIERHRPERGEQPS